MNTKLDSPHPPNKTKLSSIESEILIKYMRIKWTPSLKALHLLPWGKNGDAPGRLGDWAEWLLVEEIYVPTLFPFIFPPKTWKWPKKLKGGGGFRDIRAYGQNRAKKWGGGLNREGGIKVISTVFGFFDALRSVS